MENKTIEALEKLVALKDETIKELERQVQLLKNQPTLNVPFMPTQPYSPANPIQTITNPFTQFPYGTVISNITNGSNYTSNIPEPNRGCVTFNPNATYTLTTADGTNVIDIAQTARC
jgi:hypothetical protein